jgi:hypothetical protein
MVVETLTGLAGPWPLKLIIDGVAAPIGTPTGLTLAAWAAAASW